MSDDLTPAVPDTARPRWRRVLRAVSWAATAAVAAFAAMRLFGLETGWALVVVTAFTPYLVIAAALGAGAQAACRHWRAAAVTAVCALALTVALVPRAIGGPHQPAYGESLTVMSVNLYFGHAHLEHVVDLVDRHEPDVLSVQELTADGYAALAELGLEERLPEVVGEPTAPAWGTALYSRYPLERLPRAEPDSPIAQVAAAVTLPDGERINVLAVHATAPTGPDRMAQWAADLAGLPEPGPVPWVLAGDFNATLDHRALREVVAGGYTDAAVMSGEGLRGTWRPAVGWLRPPPVTLDRVLVDDRFTVSSFAVLEANGSDHAPVLATVRLLD